MMDRRLACGVVLLAGACVGEPAVTEQAASRATIGGKHLVLHPVFRLWHRAMVAAIDQPVGPEPGADVRAWVTIQDSRRAEIVADTILLPEARVLEIKLTGGPYDQSGSRGIVSDTTDVGFMLLHRPVGELGEPWRSVSCGDFSEGERPTNPGFHVFDDQTTIDGSNETIATRQGPVGFDRCGVTEDRPRFAVLILPRSKPGNMAHGAESPYENALAVTCNGAACPWEVSADAEQQGRIAGNGWLLYATQRNSDRVLRLDPDTGDMIGSTSIPFSAGALDLAMSGGTLTFLRSSTFYSGGTPAGQHTLDGVFDGDPSNVVIGYGPDAEGGELLLRAAEELIGGRKELVVEIGDLWRRGPTGRIGVPLDILWVPGIGCILVAEMGLFRVGTDPEGPFATLLMSTDPTNPITTLAVGPNGLFGRDRLGKTLRVDPRDWTLQYTGQTAPFRSVTSPWNP